MISCVSAQVLQASALCSQEVNARAAICTACQTCPGSYSSLLGSHHMWATVTLADGTSAHESCAPLLTMCLRCTWLNVAHSSIVLTHASHGRHVINNLLLSLYFACQDWPRLRP